MPGADGPSRARERGRVYPPLSPSPCLDEHVVEPETRQEMVGGEVWQALPPHGDTQSELDYLLRANVASGYISSSDTLSRLSPSNDFAADASIRRSGDDPRTGDRHLEELVFEIQYTQSLADLRRRAQALIAGGVRRVFVITVKGDKQGFDTEVARVLEWSGSGSGTDDWREFSDGELITDPCLRRPLPVRALRDAAEADNHVAQALIDKGNQVIAGHLAEREARGKAEGLARGKAQGLAEGRAQGLAEGKAQGLAEGEVRGAVRELRRGIVTLCRVLDIPLSATRQERLDGMDRAELTALGGHLEQHRSWPPTER